MLYLSLLPTAALAAEAHSPTAPAWTSWSFPTAFGSPIQGSSSFTDVPPASAGAVSWAVAKGVTNGTSATTFSPNKVCDRGEIVTFLYRAYH